MKPIKTALTASLLGLILLYSCNKNEKPDESVFVWRYNLTTYVAKQHEASINGIGAPWIVANLQIPLSASGSRLSILLATLQTGSYGIASTGSGRFSYVDTTGYQHMGMSGSVNITKNTGSLVSGDFSVTLSDGNLITGAFTNTPIKP
jgi:hypothetical protein